MKFYYQKIVYTDGFDKDRIFCFVVNHDVVIILETDDLENELTRWDLVIKNEITLARETWSFCPNDININVLQINEDTMPKGLFDERFITYKLLEELFVE